MNTARTTFSNASDGRRTWRLSLDDPNDQRSTDMSTQAHPGSQHLAAARQLLDEIGAATDADPQTKASAATAHAILVLAEQVAAARLTIGANGHAQPGTSS